jgi:hypothetical protein
MEKPQTTWQVFDNETGILTVHVSDNPGSEIYFQGKPEDYDGTATEPASPTGEYIKKH